MRNRLPWYTAFGGVMLIAATAPASAHVNFFTGNQQYTNVNIAADASAASLMGEIDQTNLFVTFSTMIGPDGSTPVLMHGQHGVAFIESAYDAVNTPHTGFTSLTMSAPDNYGFNAGDFKLDTLNLTGTGTVTFTSTNQFGQVETTSMPIDLNGQNGYNFTTSDGQLVTSLVFSVPTTTPLQDLKQVSVGVELIPEPASMLLLASSVLSLGLAHRARRRRTVSHAPDS